MTSASWIAALVGLLALLAAPCAARADDNHYQSLLIGERALGLGGAYTAISDDSSGVFYNPAGLGEAPHSSISLAASVYGFASTTAEIPSASFEATNRSFVSYPTTAAWLQRVRRGREDGAGRVQLALALLTPRNESSRKRHAFRAGEPALSTAALGATSENLALQVTEDETMWVGLAVGWKAWRRLCLGAAVFATIRNGLYQVHQDKVYRFFDNASGVERGRFATAYRADARLAHYGLVGLLGVLVPLSDRLRLGASFRSPTLELRGRADLNALETPADTSGKFTLQTTDLHDVTFNDRQPFKVTVGAAYLVPRRWGISLDLSWYGPVAEYSVIDDPGDPALAAATRMKKRIVWQLNVGGELYLGRSFPLRVGFFTDRSSLDPVMSCGPGGCREQSNLFTNGVDLYGVATAIGYETDRATLNLGWTYSAGARTTTLAAGGELRSAQSLMLLALGGSFRF